MTNTTDLIAARDDAYDAALEAARAAAYSARQRADLANLSPLAAAINAAAANAADPAK